MSMTIGKEHIAIVAVSVIAGIILGAGFRSCSGSKVPEHTEPVVVHDTIVVRDTVRIRAKTKVLAIHDTVWLPPQNSTTEPQMLVCETKEYRDTFQTDSSRIELGVRFSGYDAKIDNVDLQYRFNVQPRTIVKKKGWGQFIGVGIGVGYGASIVGQRVYAAPEVGLHITYGWGYHW